MKPRSVSNVGPQTENVAEDSVPKIWGRPISELPDSDFTDRTSVSRLTYAHASLKRLSHNFLILLQS